MWSSVKTRGVVLSSIPWREADRRYTALTPQFGKLEFVGRGAQKPKAKLASHLEPCVVLDLEIVRGARTMTVINVERYQSFSRVRTSVTHRLLALSSSSLLDHVVHPELEDVILYDALLEWLAFIDVQETFHPTRSTFLLGSFLLRVMRHLGYDSAHLDEMPKHAGAAALIVLAQKVSYGELSTLPLKGVDVEAFAVYVHELLAYYVPGYAERPFWRGVVLG